MIEDFAEILDLVKLGKNRIVIEKNSRCYKLYKIEVKVFLDCEDDSFFDDLDPL